MRQLSPFCFYDSVSIRCDVARSWLGTAAKENEDPRVDHGTRKEGSSGFDNSAEDVSKETFKRGEGVVRLKVLTTDPIS